MYLMINKLVFAFCLRALIDFYEAATGASKDVLGIGRIQFEPHYSIYLRMFIPCCVGPKLNMRNLFHSFSQFLFHTLQKHKTKK